MSTVDVIRNGGFETGDLQHWAIGGNVTPAVVADGPMYGIYRLRITALSPGIYAILHQDYIEAAYGDIFIITRGVREEGAYNQTGWVTLYQYNNALEYMGYTSTASRNNSTSWELQESALTVLEGVSYVRLVVEGQASAVHQRFGFDGLSMTKLDMSRNVKSMRELCSLTGITGTGSQSNDRHVLPGFTRYYAEILVSSASGTSPTLKAYVKEKDSNGQTRVLGEFSTMSSADNQRVGISPPLGEMYVSYTLGGTSASFTFDINVIGVR